MNRDDIGSIVKKILADITGAELHEVRDDSLLVTDLGIESIDMVDFSYETEKQLKMKIDLFEIFQRAQMRSEVEFLDPSVNDIVQFIEKKIQDESK